MNIIRRKKLLVRFLKENDLYNSFINNINKHGYFTNNINDIIEESNDNEYGNEICSGFNWSLTNDNIKWYTVAVEWSKILFKENPNRTNYYF